MLGDFFKQSPSPLQSLLGQYYDPAEARKQAISQAMLQAGVGLLSQGPTPYKQSFLGSLAPGLAGAAQGMKQGRDDYTRSAFDAYALNSEQQKDRDAKEKERQEAEAKADSQKRFDAWLEQSGMSPAQKLYLKANPQAADNIHSNIFPKPAEPVDPLDQEYKRAQIASLNARTANAGQGGFEYTGPDGTTFRMGGKALTESQAKDAGFYNRASQVAPQLDKVAGNLNDYGSQIGKNAPVIGNLLKSDAYRQAEQLGREFLAPILRKDTGAAVTDEELATYGGMYLPQAGDDAATMNQKREARARAVQSLKVGVPPQAILMLEMQRQQGGGEGGSEDVSTPPDGIESDIWGAMTPEERALWQN